MTKTIVEKLNLQKYNQVAILSKPEGSDYLAELTDYDTSLNGAYDLIFAFVLDMASLQELVNRVIEQQHLHKNGYLFVAYPKRETKCIRPLFIVTTY